MKKIISLAISAFLLTGGTLALAKKRDASMVTDPVTTPGINH